MDILVRDLLDMSRVEGGGLRVERTMVPVPTLLSELIEQFEELAWSRAVRLEWKVHEDVPVLRADRRRLLQTLSRTYSTTRCASRPPRGQSPCAPYAARSTRSSRSETPAPASPAEQVPHRFDRFWQATRERRGSAGLGVAIVPGIVEAHGGRNFVETAVGTGTTFHFRIPVR